jgi:hypothetical protein
MLRKMTAVLAVLVVVTLACRSDPPTEPKSESDELTHIVTLRVGSNRVGDGGRDAKFKVRTPDGTGVENAEVSISLVSAPKRLGPFRTDRSGEVVVNAFTAHTIHIQVGDVYLPLCYGTPGWPAEVIIGPGKNNSDGVPRSVDGSRDGMTTILSVWGGQRRTPTGPSEQRVQVLNRDGKGIEGVKVWVRYAPFKDSRFLTDRSGEAVVKLPDGNVRSVGFGIGQATGQAVWLDRGALRWPLKVMFNTGETKAE